MEILEQILELTLFLIQKLGENPIFYYTCWLFLFMLVVKFIRAMIWL